MGLFSSVASAAGSLFGGSGGSSWLGPVSNIAGSLISGGLSYMGQASANAFNAAEAEKNRQFQAYMRATQYQTAVEDLKKAGLNPMLAYSQGGAGNLSGAVSAPAQNELGQFVSSALQARQNLAELDNLEEQNDQIKQSVQESKDRARLLRQQAGTEVAREYRETQAGINDAKIADAQVRLMAAQARNYDANSAYTALRNRLDALDIPTKEIDAWTRKHPLGSYGRALGTLLGDVGQVTNLVRK